MSIATTLGFSDDSTSERLDSGQGIVYERTIAIGQSIIALENIGSMRVIDGVRNPMPTIIGIGIAVLGLGAMTSSKGLGFLMLVAGAAIAAWNVLRKVDVSLSLGTCDGKSTFIVSKNKQFLHDVRDFLREKIDTKSRTGATINITNSTLEGNFALAEGATAELHRSANS
jgi:hypothetical protein